MLPRHAFKYPANVCDPYSARNFRTLCPVYQGILPRRVPTILLIIVIHTLCDIFIRYVKCISHTDHNLAE